ncbi:MAG: LysE family translocator [Spirochaetes bacterium]|nr:LysE family translocator [Spirochaetota bacterium]
MDDMLFPFLAYVFVTTFTPGPNNITSTSMGMSYGYPHTLRFIAGVVSGFFLIMMSSGLLTETVTGLFPKVELFLRIIGAGYMIWLAVMIALPKKNGGHEMKTRSASSRPAGGRPAFGLKAFGLKAFGKGFMLQIVNPKVLIYAVTVYSAFLVEVIDTVFEITLAALFLTSLSFISTSAWALCGSVIKRYLQNKTVRIVFNFVMALLLLFSAASIAGIRSIL